jgi:hypothetical protein
MAAAPIDPGTIAKQILTAATNQGGATWASIQKAAPIYIRGYAQNLVDIATGVVANEISPADAKMYVENAQLLLVMGIANTSEIVLSAVQAFIDSVIGIVKDSINKALPVAIL